MKASDNEFPKVLLDMQTSSPAAPADEDWKMYAKADGIYARSSNAEVGPFGSSGITSVAHSSNTFTGALTLNAGTNVAITSPGANQLTIHSSASGSGGGAPTSAQYIVGAADGTLSAEKVRADLYKNYNPDAYPATKNAVSNEFDGSAGGSYSWTSTPGSSDENSTFPGHLYIVGSSNVAEEFYRATYAPGATDFTVVVKVQMGGRVGSDNAAWQVGAAVLSSADADIWDVRILNDSGNDIMLAHRYYDTVLTTTASSIPATHPVYLMIQRTSANVYTGYFSLNGIVWSLGGSSTVATTVDKVAVMVNNVSTNTYNRAVIDYIRVFDSLTFSIGS